MAVLWLQCLEHEIHDVGWELEKGTIVVLYLCVTFSGELKRRILILMFGCLFMDGRRLRPGEQIGGGGGQSEMAGGGPAIIRWSDRRGRDDSKGRTGFLNRVGRRTWEALPPSFAGYKTANGFHKLHCELSEDGVDLGTDTKVGSEMYLGSFDEEPEVVML